MKRFFSLIIVLIIFLFASAICVKAETTEDLSRASGAYTLDESLPRDVRKSLGDMGLNSKDFSGLSDLTFSSVIRSVLSSVSSEAGEVLPSVTTLLAILIAYSMFSGVFSTVTNTALSTVLSIITALCISLVILLPVTDVIKSAQTTIKISSDFMLAFVPVMTAILISCGQSVTASGYCTMMIVAAEVVSQLFAKFIAPLLSSFLALGVSVSVAPDIKLGGIVNFISKTLKWIMSFAFTLFTALLTFKSIYSSSVDNISSRAVRYTVSSFVPVVGGALSEAYRTLHGSVGVLKSGVGVFVIIAIVMVFLPVITRILLWLLTLNLCKCFTETTDLHAPRLLLASVSNVISLLLSVILCIMTLFIITTALIITIGGGT